MTTRKKRKFFYDPKAGTANDDKDDSGIFAWEKNFGMPNNTRSMRNDGQACK